MSIATISHFCALGSGVLRNVQCVGPSPWYGCVSSLLVYRSTSYCRAYHECELVYRRGVSQCTFSMAKAKRCPIVFVCVLEKFIRKCHRRHFDLCCVCMRVFSPLLRDKSCCCDVVINSLS